jgi:DNA-binding NtrC family response regulator
MARVLVIDDEEDMRNMLVAGLSRDGHTVFQAADGVEGTEILAREPIDLVITDILMPNKEGFEMIIELRKNRPDLKVVAMSGGGIMSGPEALRVAKNLGAHATLRKPFRIADLRRTVEECLGGAAGPPPAA